VSENPYLAFHIQQGQPGDAITIQWKDNLGAAGQLATVAV
jgi:hypothetical protein